MEEGGARHAFERAVNPPPEPVTIGVTSSADTWRRLLLSTPGRALAAGLVVMVALVFINPPAVQTTVKTEDKLTRTHRDWGKILLWGVITSILVVIVPLIWQHVSKSSAGAPQVQ